MSMPKRPRDANLLGSSSWTWRRVRASGRQRSESPRMIVTPPQSSGVGLAASGAGRQGRRRSPRRNVPRSLEKRRKRGGGSEAAHARSTRVSPRVYATSRQIGLTNRPGHVNIGLTVRRTCHSPERAGEAGKAGETFPVGESVRRQRTKRLKAVLRGKACPFTFWDGFGSALDICGSYFRPVYEPSDPHPFVRDALAIREDWQAVGRDLRRVVSATG